MSKATLNSEVLTWVEQAVIDGLTPEMQPLPAGELSELTELVYEGIDGLEEGKHSYVGADSDHDVCLHDEDLIITLTTRAYVAGRKAAVTALKEGE
jgi:hypothetical protein